MKRLFDDFMKVYEDFNGHINSHIRNLLASNNNKVYFSELSVAIYGDDCVKTSAEQVNVIFIDDENNIMVGYDPDKDDEFESIYDLDSLVDILDIIYMIDLIEDSLDVE